MSEHQEHLFLQLIFMFQTAAMQHMGKLKNPLTDTIDRDLDQASVAIDILDMLKQKTKGNVTEEEARMLDTVLSTLKLNYVEERSKESKADESS